MQEPEPFVDVERTAEHLGMSAWWLYERGDEAGVPCYRLGGTRRYLLTEVTKWAKAQR